MKEQVEINKGYIPTEYARIARGEDVANGTPRSRVRGLLDRTGLGIVVLPIWRLIYHTCLVVTRPLRRNAALWHTLRLALTLPVLILSAAVISVYLRLLLWVRGHRPDERCRAAGEHVPSFVEQYPFHFYPVLCKSYELAFLKPEIDAWLAAGDRIVEVAIGEGSLSGRAFPPEARIVGLDLNPQSLYWAAQRPHCAEAIVCDCLEPPITPGTFDVLLANNILHHITRKGPTLRNWGRVARKVVFNENTRYWANCWFQPYMLRKLGLTAASKRWEDEIERHSLQCLLPREELDAAVTEAVNVVRCESYLSERVFAICGYFSYLMGVEGPPTPALIRKAATSGLLGPLCRGLTVMLGRLMLAFDQTEPRSRDAFVSYASESRDFEPGDRSAYLCCPDCRVALAPTRECPECGRRFQSKDELFFLLPRELSHIEEGYSPRIALEMTGEHL